MAANRAWFEYQPARVTNPGSKSLQAFHQPAVNDAPIETFDHAGLGTEPNNLAAIGSLIGYRALRWGRHLDLIITDQRSYRSEDPAGRREIQPLADADFLGWMPEQVFEILDAGRAYRGGQAPPEITAGDARIDNFRRNDPPQTILGVAQLDWFLDRLRRSSATWKVWGNSMATLDARIDLQNLPAGLTKPWGGGAGYASMGGGDFGTAYVERGTIYDFIRDTGITGFAIVSGDRHAFWAGLAAKALPPAPFEPVGVAFVTGSISSAGAIEAQEHNLPRTHPLRPVVLADRAGQSRPEPTLNMSLRHGVRASLEYARTGDLAKARALTNPDLAPHVAFVDLGGHGFARVKVDGSGLEAEFVCIPRPIERSAGTDGGPVLYRVRHRAELWKRGEPPKLTQTVVEGDVGLGG